MEPEIIQQKTKKTPAISYDPGAGTMTIEGRSIPENPESLYKLLRDWLVKFFSYSDNLRLKIILEYINSGSSKHLLEILKLIKEYKEGGKTVRIIWYYEEDDEAIMELGEHYRDTSGIPIEIEMLLG
ncbi:MAG TPA: DUF1987 domain-containing protein [Bacteroidales bacterium]|nr:DUF1987 domain-containing protein [Bacteroidales bacterium]